MSTRLQPAPARTARTGSSSPRRRRGAGRTSPPERPRSSAPDPRRLVEAVARAYLEVEAGRRPLHQLAPLLAPALRLRLEGTHQRRRSQLGPDVSSVVGLRCCELGDDIVEATVTVQRGSRAAALVIRAERWRGSWRIGEIARPEDARQAP